MNRERRAVAAELLKDRPLAAQKRRVCAKVDLGRVGCAIRLIRTRLSWGWAGEVQAAPRVRHSASAALRFLLNFVLEHIVRSTLK